MIRSCRTLKRSFSSFFSLSLVLLCLTELIHTNQLGDDEPVIKQLRRLGCQRSAFPYRHGNLVGKNMENMTTRAAPADNNEEISIFFPHQLEIKYEIFMTMFCENLITDGARDMAIKKCGHDRKFVWAADKEQGNSYHGARSFLNRTNSSIFKELYRPQSTEKCTNSPYLMNYNRTDDLNSEKATNCPHHQQQQQRRRHLIKSTKFQHTLEAYFTISKDVPLNQRYFLDTILLPISVLYCILDHHHRRLTTIST